MITKKITDSEVEPLSIASLPTRPTAPSAFGGKGFTPSQMKACFDALPKLIIERVNELITELDGAYVSERVLSMPVGLDIDYTIADFLAEFSSGTLVDRLALGNGGEAIGIILPDLIRRVDAFYYMDKDYIIDAGRPGERREVI